MNWNLETLEPLSAADLPAAVDALQLPEGVEGVEAEAQLAAAKEAAKTMVASGAVGDPSPEAGLYFGAEFACTTNLDHAPPEEGPADRVYVGVRQIAWEPPPAEDEIVAAEDEEPVAEPVG